MKLDLPKPALFLLIMAMFLFFGWYVPQTLVLSEGELFNEETTFQSNLFNNILFGGLALSSLLFFLFMGWKRNNKYGDINGVIGEGNYAGSRWWHKYDLLQRIIISILVGGLIFFTSTLLRLGTFTGLRVLPQQFTPVKSLIFSTLMIPFSENPMAIGLIMVTILLMTFLAIKYDISVNDFKIYILIIVPIVLGSFAILWHRTAYAGSDYALGVVFAFWFIGGLISIYLEDAIPFLIAHMFNNFFIDFTRLFTSDTALITVALFIFGIPALVWVLVYGFKFKGSKT